MKRICLALVVSTGTVTAPAVAGCDAHSPPQRAHLIELYTSEGCSSCPPADRWVGALAVDASLVALAFHVDYWDSLGWKDRFADPRYTRRQSDLAAHGGNSVVYTPEIALDGREWRAWSHSVPESRHEAAAVELTLAVEPGTPLRLHLTSRFAATANVDAYRAYFALTEDGLSSDVRAGENRGALLTHDHVVRAFAGPFRLDRADATLDLPDDVRVERATVVAFVQEPDSGAVAQVVRQALAACAIADGR